ncbi:MAG: hypothetical protein IK111_08780 [Lachnospiraceae bacterium]|nr:hypothetical protein [Lachnospiraceae bacterium]
MNINTKSILAATLAALAIIVCAAVRLSPYLFSSGTTTEYDGYSAKAEQKDEDAVQESSVKAEQKDEEQVREEPLKDTQKPEDPKPKEQKPDRLEPKEQKQEQTKSLRFRNKKLLNEHYEKHGIDMGFKSAQEYEEAASKAALNPDALHKTEKEDGDDVYYVAATNEFVIVSTDGYIRTYFNPDSGIKYYNKQ